MNTRPRFRVALLLGILLTVFGCSGDTEFGVVISQSGSLASYGTVVKNALDLAAEEINAEGGVNGGQIKLIYKDDATNAERGKQVVRELVDESGVDAIIGAISSSVTMAIAPICEDEHVILLSPAASTPELTDAGNYIFRNWPSDVLEGTAMAKFSKDLGLERIVVFAMDNDFGRGLEGVFTEQYVGSSQFREVAEVFRWADGETGGFPEMVAQAKELEPDGIYIVAYVGDLADLLKQIQAAGIKAVKMGSASIREELIALAGDATEALVYPQAGFDVNSTDPTVANFVSAYRNKYGDDPDIYAAHAYDALKILAAAMELGGSSHPDHIRSGLNSMQTYNGAAGRTEFDQLGDVVRYPRIFIIRDGRVQAYEKFVEQGGSLLIDG